MPFPDHKPRPYTMTRVRRLKKGQIGVYGLFRSKVPVYVGSGDIRQRLIDHLNGDNPCITREKPTHWVDMVTAEAGVREKTLIRELDPVCNQRVG